MKKSVLFVCALIASISNISYSYAQTVLWKSTQGKTHYRIPALAINPEGKLIAIVDDRGNDVSDLGNNHVINLVQKTGTPNADLEYTWSESSTIIKGGGSGFDKAHGDAAVVCDRETGKLLIMCASGEYGITGDKSGGNKIKIGKYTSDAIGSELSGKEVTDDIYGLIPEQVTGAFVSSGKIFQSKFIKTGTSYRIYAVLNTFNTYSTNHNGNYVIYSDDFGESWKVLGGTKTSPAPDGDEAKCEELPNGDVLLSSRVKGGRYFNVFQYTDKKTYTEGSWNGVVQSNKTNNGIYDDSGTNGEILIVPAKLKNAGTPVYVALQSVPYGSGRTHMSIYYKVFRSMEDFSTPQKIATDWKRYEVNTGNGAYSTMMLGRDGKILFLYENGDTQYSITYQEFDLDEITKNYDPCIYNAELDNDKFIYGENDDPWNGKIVMLKAVGHQYSKGTNNYKELFSLYLKSKDASLEAVKEEYSDTPTEQFFWIITKNPNFDQTGYDNKIKNNYVLNDKVKDYKYYLTNMSGDGYIGNGLGIYWPDGLDDDGNPKTWMPDYPTCLDDFTKAIPVNFFENLRDYNNEASIGKNVTGISANTTTNKTNAIDGVSLLYAIDGTNTANTVTERYIAIGSDGNINRLDHTNSNFYGSNQYWTTDFTLIEVKPGETEGTGSWTNPTIINKMPVKFVRSDDGCAGNGDYNKYATLNFPYELVMPDDVTAYRCASDLNYTFNATVVGLEESDQINNTRIIPRNTPVLLKIDGNEGDGIISETRDFILRAIVPLPKFEETNLFDGTLPRTRIYTTEEYDKLGDAIKPFVKKFNPETQAFYVLGKKNGKVAMYKLGMNDTDNHYWLAANKAYYFHTGDNDNLLPAAVAFNFKGETTGISNITVQSHDNNVYDIYGRRINGTLKKGIYIKNGKKFVVR